MRSSIKYCGVGCYKHPLLDRGSNSRRLNPTESSRENLSLEGFASGRKRLLLVTFRIGDTLQLS